MLGVIFTTIALALANVGWEAFTVAHNYAEAFHITWMQFTALLIYRMFWSEK